jgi:hypothetical protein
MLMQLKPTRLALAYPGSTVAFYPMKTESRRKERRE